jgi:hypothetical protein
LWLKILSALDFQENLQEVVYTYVLLPRI